MSETEKQESRRQSANLMNNDTISGNGVNYGNGKRVENKKSESNAGSVAGSRTSVRGGSRKGSIQGSEATGEVDPERWEDMDSKPGSVRSNRSDVELRKDETKDPLIVCPECKETYGASRIPRLLPCLHSICEICVNAHIDTLVGKVDATPSCPICHKNYVLPEGQVGKLPLNYLAINVVHFYYSEGYRRVCGNCESHPKAAIFLCRDCDIMLCDTCHAHHKVMKVFQSHNVIELAVKNNKAKRIENKDAANLDNLMVNTCPLHHKEIVRVCVTCDVLMCTSCEPLHMKSSDSLTEHKWSSIIPKFIQGYNTEVNHLRSRVMKRMNLMERKISGLGDRVTTLKESAVQTKDTLEDMYNQIQAHIKEIHDRIETNLDLVVDQQVRELEETKNFLEVALEPVKLYDALLQRNIELFKTNTSTSHCVVGTRTALTTALQHPPPPSLPPVSYIASTDMFDKNKNIFEDNLPNAVSIQVPSPNAVVGKKNYVEVITRKIDDVIAEEETREIVDATSPVLEFHRLPMVARKAGFHKVMGEFNNVVPERIWFNIEVTENDPEFIQWQQDAAAVYGAQGLGGAIAGRQGEVKAIGDGGPQDLEVPETFDPDFRVISLQQQSEEYRQVERQFKDSIPEWDNFYQVMKIERIENPMLKDAFNAAKKRLEKIVSGSAVREKILFHWTRGDMCELINTWGLRAAYESKNYMRAEGDSLGVSFTRDAGDTYADLYAGHMYVCRVLIARCYVGDVSRAQRSPFLVVPRDRSTTPARRGDDDGSTPRKSPWGLANKTEPLKRADRQKTNKSGGQVQPKGKPSQKVIKKPLETGREDEEPPSRRPNVKIEAADISAISKITDASLFDCLIDDLVDPNTYVIFYNYQMYPEYLITYE